MATAFPNRDVKAEDLYDLPDDGLKYELVAGVLVSEPLPGARHGRLAFRTGVLIERFLCSHPLGVIIGNDSGFVLARSPDTVRGPDVAFVTKERFDAVGDRPTHFPGPPDLAVEVRSPGDREGDVRSKVADYLAAGTRLVWLVDPETSSVTVYGPGLPSLLAPRVFSSDETLDGGDVLPGFAVQVSQLFALP